jgi:hypothetical protein
MQTQSAVMLRYPKGTKKSWKQWLLRTKLRLKVGEPTVRADSKFGRGRLARLGLHG